jgi:hypothetical protein
MFTIERRSACRPPVATAFLGAAIILASACATNHSRLTDAWRDPAYAGPPVRTVLVVAASTNATRRRVWEDAFVAALKQDNVQATPSYTMFPNDIPSVDSLQQRVGDGTFDAVVLTHHLSTEDRQHYVPGYTQVRPVGAYYDPFWRSYRYVYQRIHTPGYVENDRVLRFETGVYDLRNDGKLVWVGTSETLNPESAGQVSREISQLIVPGLREAKIL